jgi:N-acetylglutamate synthase/N-acetylornithine aminotransferase
VRVQVEIGGKTVRVGGIAKGSGMIHPNMATMLGVVTCDADVEVGLWRALFKRAAVKSFNQARGRCAGTLLRNTTQTRGGGVQSMIVPV